MISLDEMLADAEFVRYPGRTGLLDWLPTRSRLRRSCQEYLREQPLGQRDRVRVTYYDTKWQEVSTALAPIVDGGKHCYCGARIRPSRPHWNGYADGRDFYSEWRLRYEQMAFPVVGMPAHVSIPLV